MFLGHSFETNSILLYALMRERTGAVLHDQEEPLRRPVPVKTPGIPWAKTAKTALRILRRLTRGNSLPSPRPEAG